MTKNKPKYKGFYNIVKNEASKEATINIYGVIGGFDFDSLEWINTADKFTEDFKKVEKEADIINVKINSPGGSIWDGLPIYNTLNNSKKHINTYVDGIAYSMASLIALAGDKVYGYANSMLMFHNGSSFSFGNAKEMRQEADTLDSYDEALGTIIEEKLNITAEEVKDKYLNYSDNYFVGKKAQEIGFFDEILTTKKADVPEDIKNMSPKDILSHYSKMNFEPATDATNTREKMKNKTYLKIQNALDMEAPFEATDEGVFLNEGQLDTLETKFIDLAADIKEATDEQKAAADKIAAMQKASDEAATEEQNFLDAVNEFLNLEADAATAEISEVLNAFKKHVELINDQPGDAHTTVNPQGEPAANKHEYIDFTSPLYQPNK